MLQNNIPTVGQTMIVREVECVITKIWPLGTVDVLSKDGKHAWRVTGLYCPGWPK
jgi:hypothetical protein